jgi:hypothetical protein
MRVIASVQIARHGVIPMLRGRTGRGAGLKILKSAILSDQFWSNLVHRFQRENRLLPPFPPVQRGTVRKQAKVEQK